MLLHVDASTHAWLGARRGKQDLIVVFDDATSQVYYARLVEQESTETVMAALKAVVAQQGVFVPCTVTEAATLLLLRWPEQSRIATRRRRLAEPQSS